MKKRNGEKITIDKQKKADLQIKKKQKLIDYDTKDYTLELLINKFKKGDFFIPEYQRKFVWQNKDKSLFLESVLLGLPIPFMFFATCNDGKMEIIDGVQRMNTIVEFIDDNLILSGLKKLTELNEFRFSDLSDAQKRKFADKTLRTIILKENTPNDARQDLFYRINTSGKKATDSEIRRGSYPGPLTSFIEKCSKREDFISLSPMSEKIAIRQERFELVLRFFAYLNEYKAFKHDVNVFLDDYLKKNINDFNKKEFQSNFDNMLQFVHDNFPAGFAKSSKAKSTPRVRFEAIAIGVALALKERPDLKISNVDWLESKEFKKLTTSNASNNEGRLKKRVEYVRDQLLK